MAARFFTNSAAGADWQFWRYFLKNGALMFAAPCCKALDLSVCLAGNSQAQIKKGALIQSPHLGVFLRPKLFFSPRISDAPPKGLSEARLPVNVYVIEYAAKLRTTKLTAKFFNENFVKKSRLFYGRD